MHPPEPLSLQIFYGISSPWAYFGARRAVKIGHDAGVSVKLRPIRLIEANGGIPLRTRPDARQLYHAVELERWSRHLGIPLNLKPKFYPCRTIEPAAQAVIAVQKAGLAAFDFSFAIQRALWAEDRDIADLSVLREIAARTVGPQAEALVVDPQPDAIIAEWNGNLEEAKQLGIFGTPTYVVGEDIFWGQDRLDFVARRFAERNNTINFKDIA